MKKFLRILMIVASFFVCPPKNTAANTCAAEPGFAVLEEQVWKENGECIKISLGGTGAPLVKDIKIEIYRENKRICSLSPTRKYGYDPTIKIYDFVQGEPFLFYAAQSGGSGGYGYYDVYRLKGGKCVKVYSEEEDSQKNKFTGEFVPGCKMALREAGKKNRLVVDVSYMSPEFLSRIFSKDCKTVYESVHINPISVVFPYFNAAVGDYQLLTYRSVTAVAEVNRLGYVTQNLEFSDGGFRPYFTNFSLPFDTKEN